MLLPRRSLFLILVLFALPAFCRAEFETSVKPEKEEKYKSADFRLWLPDKVKHLRAIIIRQHGCGRKGLDHADDVQWRALARKWDCALLGTHFKQDKDCSDWWNPTNGSERALLAALKTFADKSEHPELTTIPWALWGHSGGASWAMSLTYRHPERVVAVFARSMAVNGDEVKARSVPVLFNYGAREKTGRFEMVHKRVSEVFSTHRPKGALWAVAIDPKSEHNCGNSRALAIPFFDTLLAQRLPPAGKSGPLRAVDLTKAWLGDPQTLAISPAAKFTGDKDKASWLPDEAMARRWQEFCKTGEIKDKTPPPAPTQVNAVLVDGKVRLTWTAEADLESGIKRFHIYRDGKRVGFLGGAATGGNRYGHYQTWNYGDEPEPRPGPMLFIDKNGSAKARYQVTTENHAGLESAKSEEATVKSE